MSHLKLSMWVALCLLSVANKAWDHDPPTPPTIGKPERRAVSIPIRDFSLTDQNGRLVGFRQLRGKVVVLGFAYTTCPDICPLITAAMRVVQAELTPVERDEILLITTTTDPEVDRPPVLKAYAERYGVDLSNWLFLTGDEPSLASVWKNFGVRVQRKARGLVDHTALTAVIDQKGVMRFAYHGSSPDPNIVLKDIRSLLMSR